ncbi:MAG: FAD-dependent oxidoreductase [Enterovirga sp.]|jgi:glycine oxidase|nr:FAD-dependent oxidoreductase [Enterovirga sp.]
MSEPVSVVGAGIAGTWTALLLAESGRRVTVYERQDEAMTGATSHWAGGMLAPDCEGDGAEPVVIRLGHRSVQLWRSHLPETPLNGSLVVSHPRDRADLERLARQTAGHERIGAARIGEIEPALAGRFREALFYPGEGHVEPRRALPALHAKLRSLGGEIRFGADVRPEALDGTVVDCRGLGAREAQPELRGVKGETVLVETAEIALSRPVRLMHPRWPIYVIPRANNRFLIGASTIETEDAAGVTLRSALELMTAAYTVHPAFGEARIVELGTALRPAYPDHSPRIAVAGRQITVNGLYRHGFLIAPALGELVANYIAEGTRDNEVMRWS